MILAGTISFNVEIVSVLHRTLPTAICSMELISPMTNLILIDEVFQVLLYCFAVVCLCDSANLSVS